MGQEWMTAAVAAAKGSGGESGAGLPQKIENEMRNSGINNISKKNNMQLLPQLWAL